MHVETLTVKISKQDDTVFASLRKYSEVYSFKIGDAPTNLQVLRFQALNRSDKSTQ
jgi:hypothetical protein